ncbi:hypothetical protein ABPG75_011458 [Micractinium tetrahymenae]
MVVLQQGCGLGPKAALAAAGVAPQLREQLRNATAVVPAEGGGTAYILGMSHVSRESCQHIDALIRAVKPDIVLLELCKDRTGLLVDPDAPPPQVWWTPRLAVASTPSLEALAGGQAGAPGWPSTGQLLARLHSRGCSPVTAADIEDDAVALLSTGLFRSVRIVAQPPSVESAPAFVVPPSGAELQTVAPLERIEYVAVPRQLPGIKELSFRAEGGAELPSEAAQGAARAAAAAAAPGVAAYLAARAALLACLPQGLDVCFEGVEAGKPTAVVLPVPAGQQRCLTGLEGTAANGAGPFIEPFKRQTARRQQQPGGSSSSSGGIQLGAASKRPQGGSGGFQAALEALQNGQGAELTPWSPQQLAQGMSAASSSSGGSGGNALATFLTTTYAKYQGAVGRTVGVAPGEAWRVALRAAVAAGATQVHLGDLPGDTTGRRLADAILSSSLPLLLGSLVASAASAIVLSQGLLDSGAPANPAAVAAAAALPVALALAPVVAPLLEVRKFAGLSASQIEDTVRLSEPLQAASLDAPAVKLWGEDALLKWPGAMQPIIHSRDAYMARSIAAAASGRPEGLTPAFVLTQAAGVDGAGAEGGAAVLQYAMPQGGDPGACPPGAGAGQYAPLKGPRTVVAVVGTAHVRGMLREWGPAQRDCSLRGLL